MNEVRERQQVGESIHVDIPALATRVVRFPLSFSLVGLC